MRRRRWSWGPLVLVALALSRSASATDDDDDDAFSSYDGCWIEPGATIMNQTSRNRGGRISLAFDPPLTEDFEYERGRVYTVTLSGAGTGGTVRMMGSDRGSWRSGVSGITTATGCTGVRSLVEDTAATEESFTAEWTAPAGGGTIRFGASRAGPISYGADSIQFGLYEPDVKRVLLLGTSLSPGTMNLLDRLTATAGPTIITTWSTFLHSSTLRTHAAPGSRSRREIARGIWDFIIIQEQSGSFFQFTEEHLDRYGQWRRLDDGSITHNPTYPHTLVNESRFFNPNAKVVFKMTWRVPDDMRLGLQPELAAAFTRISGIEQTMCAPCGNAMLLNMETYGDDQRAFPDDIHPTVLSQYTNACVLYATLTGLSPIGLGDAGTNLNGDGYDVTLLQTNAWLAYTSYRDEQRLLCTGYHCVRFINPSDGTLDIIPSTTTAPRTEPWMDPNVPPELVCPIPPADQQGTTDCGDHEEPAVCDAAPRCGFAAGFCLRQICAAYLDESGCVAMAASGCVFSSLGDRCVDSGVPAGMATIADSEIFPARGLVPGGEPPLPLLAQLSSACAGVWERCYSGEQDGWGASQLHSRCNLKGPTLAIIRSGGRIYGGFAPQSWTSRRSQSLAARGGWLFRFTSGRFDFVDLLSRSMTVMHDYSNECIWLGKHNDLKLTRSCQQLDTVFVRPNTYHGVDYDCDGAGDCYNSSWLAGSIGPLDVDELEVFYNPELEAISLMTRSPTIGPNTTAVPTTAVPTTTASSSLDPTTAAPGTVAPASSAPVTAAPATAAQSLDVTAAPATAAQSLDATAPVPTAPPTDGPASTVPGTSQPTASPNTARSTDSSSGSTSDGKIGGITRFAVIGGGIAFILVIAGAVVCLKRRRRQDGSVVNGWAGQAYKNPAYAAAGGPGVLVVAGGGYLQVGSEMDEQALQIDSAPDDEEEC